MTDDSKSFHCKELNCEMTFFNEQSLNVHQQTKHTKLNLEIPTKTFCEFSNFQMYKNLIFLIPADNQTPTPTRLLNKCEELRVFDDPYIQNLNPFDEGFAKAISNENRDNFLAVQQQQQNQDTLHTPQIIPDFLTRPKESQKPQDEPENLSLTPTEHIPKILINHVEVTKPIPVLPKPSVIYAQPLQLHLTNEDHPNVKDKLKSVILGNSTTSTLQKRVKLNENEKMNLPTILIATPILTAPNLIINNAKVKKEVVNEEEMKVKSSRKSESTTKVERNRAAARRYRTKMKAQGQAMRDKYDKAIKEIGQLRKEVTELKRLLLLHKDCEITRQMS